MIGADARIAEQRLVDELRGRVADEGGVDVGLEQGADRGQPRHERVGDLVGPVLARAAVGGVGAVVAARTTGRAAPVPAAPPGPCRGGCPTA